MKSLKVGRYANTSLIQVLKAFIVSLLLIFILAGCYDAKEIDELTYVLAIGVDKGVADTYRLTVKFHTMKEAGGGGAGGKGGGGGGMAGGEHEIITIDALSFFTGINMINAAVPRKLNFMHAKFLVFSEEIAKTGVGEFIAPIIRFREIRRTLHVIVARGKASDFLAEYEPVVGTTLSKAMELVVAEPANIGFFAHITLNDFYNGLKSTYRQPTAILGGINKFENFREDGPTVPDTGNMKKKEYYAGEIPRKGGSKIEFYGTAVFNGDKMVGELTGEETRLMNILTGKFRRGFFTIEDPKAPPLIVPLDVREQRAPDIKVKLIDGKPYINVVIRLEGDILAVQSRLNYEEDPLKTLLQDSFIKQIKNEMNTLIERCQKMDSDIFRFGRIVSSKFYTLQEWQNFNWIKKFKDAEVNIDMDFAIRRTGTLLKSSPILTTEEAK
ncbi:MAG TPA: Ger(x)C family spore germination protein [Clostridiales bacterium]|nr:Ger(x)C family spore germination protein [Clostridiales bacterium]